LVVEVKNLAKITFLSFNATAVFLHELMVPENDVWCIFMGNFEIRL